MSYNNFTEEKIFSSASINVLCNKIFEEITTAFPDDVDTDFGTTGTFAKILNGDEATTTALKVIPFITNNKELFDYCANVLPKKINATSVKYTDSIQLNQQNIFLEIWKTNTLDLITSNTIKCQRTADIPNNIN